MGNLGRSGDAFKKCLVEIKYGFHSFPFNGFSDLTFC